MLSTEEKDVIEFFALGCANLKEEAIDIYEKYRYHSESDPYIQFMSEVIDPKSHLSSCSYKTRLLDLLAEATKIPRRPS